MPGSKKFPLLTTDNVIQSLQILRKKQKVRYMAFYSSQLGGIVTDPALMVIPFDDHMVHRGHGIFDTAIIIDGKIYELEAHLDRFLRSAESSKLHPRFTRSEMREIIIQTAATSGEHNAFIRYWLSSGTGTLGLAPVEDAEYGFFISIHELPSYPESYYSKGMRVMTTSFPIKPPLYANTKSTNYLPNVLMHLEAKENGFDTGVFVDMNGNVGEGTNMNVAFVTKEGILKHPRFDNILSGCTVQRMLELAARLIESGLLNGIEIRDISVEEGRRSTEMMFFGSSIQVAPIVEWDGKMIGDGKPGPVAKALRNLLYEDQHSEDGPLTEIPYGPSKSTS